MTSTWDTFAREGERNEGGGDFAERPHVPDGVYPAVVARVGEPYDKPNSQSGEMETKFVVEFELTDDDLPEGTMLPVFPKLTTRFLESGALHPKAGLYQIMEALGFDMERFSFNPPEWVGMPCQVIVKNEGDTSWINGYLKAKKSGGGSARNAPAPTPPRQPVGAGARTRGPSSPPADTWQD